MGYHHLFSCSNYSICSQWKHFKASFFEFLTYPHDSLWSSLLSDARLSRLILYVLFPVTNQPFPQEQGNFCYITSFNVISCRVLSNSSASLPFSLFKHIGQQRKKRVWEITLSNPQTIQMRKLFPRELIDFKFLTMVGEALSALSLIWSRLAYFSLFKEI